MPMRRFGAGRERRRQGTCAWEAGAGCRRESAASWLVWPDGKKRSNAAAAPSCNQRPTPCYPTPTPALNTPKMYIPPWLWFSGREIQQAITSGAPDVIRPSRLSHRIRSHQMVNAKSIIVHKPHRLHRRPVRWGPWIQGSLGLSLAALDARFTSSPCLIARSISCSRNLWLRRSRHRRGCPHRHHHFDRRAFGQDRVDCGRLCPVNSETVLPFNLDHPVNEPTFVQVREPLGNVLAAFLMPIDTGVGNCSYYGIY